MSHRLARALFSIVLGTLMVVSCTHKEVNTESPDALFAEAEEAYNDEKYLIAIERYRDIKNRFPYSNRAVDAELRIADSFFEQESYIEAESAYEIFKELHPTHAKSDYVQYRIGLSLNMQIPSNPTRDLTAAQRSIDAFEVMIEKFPSSTLTPKARELIFEARKKMAEHEHYVADFYFRRRHYLSSTYRYSALLQEFPNMGYDEEALFRLGKSYANVKMIDNAKDTLKRFVSRFPNSSYRTEAETLLKEMTN